MIEQSAYMSPCCLFDLRISRSCPGILISLPITVGFDIAYCMLPRLTTRARKVYDRVSDPVKKCEDMWRNVKKPSRLILRARSNAYWLYLTQKGTCKDMLPESSRCVCDLRFYRNSSTPGRIMFILAWAGRCPRMFFLLLILVFSSISISVPITVCRCYNHMKAVVWLIKS
jgi:hypothetical protein